MGIKGDSVLFLSDYGDLALTITLFKITKINDDDNASRPVGSSPLIRMIRRHLQRKSNTLVSPG